MKSKKQILIAGILLCLSCGKTTAQAPYSASAGGLLGINAGGFSSKFFFTDNVAFQSDILCKVTLTKVYGGNLVFYPALETNSNLMYQKKIKNKKSSEQFGFIGGGINLGCVPAGYGKFGVSAIIGLEYVFRKKPLAIQIDFRPGYGLLFHYGEEMAIPLFNRIESPWSHFDWMFGFTLRRTYKEKTSQPTPTE